MVSANDHRKEDEPLLSKAIKLHWEENEARKKAVANKGERARELQTRMNQDFPPKGFFLIGYSNHCLSGLLGTNKAKSFLLLI